MTHPNIVSILLRFLVVALVAASGLVTTEQPAEAPSAERSTFQDAAEKTASAEPELLKATEDQPNNPEAWLAYAHFQTEHHQWQKALEPLQRAISLGNSAGTTFLDLGIAYQYAEDRARALENYTKALEHGCDKALLYRGRLHFLMGKSDLALEDLDNAIEHQIEPAKIFLERGSIQFAQKDINRALADYTSAIEADPKSCAAYSARARLRNDIIGDFHGAIDDFSRAIELDPKSPAAYGDRGTAYLEHHDYDKGVADIQEAIHLNPDDIGQAFEPSTDKALDPAALAHGEKQLRKMLADRPQMAKHVEEGDKLWAWAVRKFAGEDLGTPIDWDPASPDPFESRSCEPANGKHGMIEVNLWDQPDPFQPAASARTPHAFEQSWACAVYELYNVTSSREWARLSSAAAAGKLSKENYIQAMMRTEHNATQRSRAFYIKFFLPWLRAKDLNSTTPTRWFTNDFRNGDSLRSDFAFDGNNVYLAFYENSYDLQAAYLEGARGNFDGTKTIVTRLLAHPDGLAESQITYAQSLLDWANQSSGNSPGVLGSLARSFNALTRIVEADPSSVDSLRARAMAYFDLGRTDEALADLTAALEIEPKAIDVLITRANLLGRTHKYKEAKRDIDTALAIDPESREALNLRGYADFYSGDYAQAVDDFTKTFDPRDEHLLYMRGSSYARLKKYDQALTDLEALVQLQPTNANAYALRGTVFHYLKQYQKALTDFDRAIQLDPTLATPYVNRALLRSLKDSNLRRPEQALQDARRGCELTEWRDAGALRALAAAYVANNDYLNAVRWQEKVVQLAAADRKDESEQLLATYKKQLIKGPAASPSQPSKCGDLHKPCCNPCHARCHNLLHHLFHH